MNYRKITLNEALKFINANKYAGLVDFDKLNKFTKKFFPTAKIVHIKLNCGEWNDSGYSTDVEDVTAYDANNIVINPLFQDKEDHMEDDFLNTMWDLIDGYDAGSEGAGEAIIKYDVEKKELIGTNIQLYIKE